MKKIKYRLVEFNSESGEKRKGFPVELGWSVANEEIAKREAYNGEYSIEDDGLPEEVNIMDDIDNMLVDHELRLALLELEV